MRQELEKDTVVVKKIRMQNKSNGYTIFDGTILHWRPRKKEFVPTKEEKVFVGYFFFINPGDRFEIESQEISHKIYGTEYIVVFSKRLEPGTLQELRMFLRKNIKGMTPKRTEQVLEKYGMDTLNVVRQDEHALDFLGLSDVVTGELHDSLLKNRYFEEIQAFLQLNHIDCRYAIPLQEEYGENAIDVMEANPYKPYFNEIYDFKTADMLYLSLGKAPDGIQRCSFVLLATLEQDAKSNGNVFTKRADLKIKMRQCLGCREEEFPFDETTIEDASSYLQGLHSVIVDKTFGEEVFYLKENFEDESSIAVSISRIIREPKRFSYAKSDIDVSLNQYEDIHRIKLSKGQREAVAEVLTSPICIITGGPGTGKTQTVNALIHTIETLSPSAKIKTCAPTGKAAMRLAELTQLPATTIHRLIKIGAWDGPLDAGELNCDFLIVDEFSMADVNICAKLLKAAVPSSRIVIVGDYNQLPSVGPGLVLRDMIASHKITTVVLKEVFRQAQTSRIVTNAHRIINQIPGQPIRLQLGKTILDDFVFIEENDQKKILKILQDVVGNLTSGNFKPSDIQVLSPLHRTDLGVDRLNMVLQEQLNPESRNSLSIDVDDKTFRVGDKVIHTKNNSELEVFNGECGIVSDIMYMDKKALCVSFPDRDVWYPRKALNQLELAYAMTIHKTQGSEFPVVILPVHAMLFAGLNKNSIYTALTRAKSRVIIIGERYSLSEGLRKETSLERDSYLMEKIRKAC